MADRSESRPTRWDPWRDLGPSGRGEPFQGLSWLDDFFTPAVRRAAAVSPAIDVHEDDDRYVITVELAGVRKEDIHLEIEQNVLTIRGEKRLEEEVGKNRQRRWTERAYGAFQRSFTLPGDADADRMDAEFRDGVLTIRVPKSEVAKPRSVSIK
jgi:HSP20 family protein